MKKKSEDGPVATEEAVLALFTPEELTKLEERATFWMSGDEGKQDLAEYAEKTALVVYQITAAVATGRKMVPGRTGANIMARAMRDYVALAERVLKVLQAHESKEVK